MFLYPPERFCGRSMFIPIRLLWSSFSMGKHLEEERFCCHGWSGQSGKLPSAHYLPACGLNVVITSGYLLWVPKYIFAKNLEIFLFRSLHRFESRLFLYFWSLSFVKNLKEMKLEQALKRLVTHHRWVSPFTYWSCFSWWLPVSKPCTTLTVHLTVLTVERCRPAWPE